MKIRAIKAGDAKALGTMIAEFEEYLWKVYGRKKKIDRNARIGAIRRTKMIEDSKIEGLIAEDNGKFCGFALFHASYNTGDMVHTLYMPDLYVRPGYRRKGVGRNLMKRLVEIAAERKCKAIDWTVWDMNAAALAFYIKLGAKPVSEEIVMRLKLKAPRKRR